jgi:acyl carrier protein
MSFTSSNDTTNAALRRESIESSVRAFVLQQFPAARSRHLGADDSLLANGIVDSLGVLEVVAFIENEFRLAIGEDEMLADHFESISRITDLITRKLAREDATWTS